MKNKYFYLNTKKENLSKFQNNFRSIYGQIGKAKGVIVHDAAAGINATAENVANYTINNMQSANYHDVIDDKGNCYAIVNMHSTAYHTGSTEGNSHYIGIEIAPSLTGGDFNNQKERDKYESAWNEACKLTADYLVYFNLSTENIKQDREFKNTLCPYTMMKFFKTYEKALEETKKQVKKYMNEIKRK